MIWLINCFAPFLFWTSKPCTDYLLILMLIALSFVTLREDFLEVICELYLARGEWRLLIVNWIVNSFFLFFVEILTTTCNISWTTNWMLQINILCSFLIHAYFCQFQCSLSSALVVWVHIRNSQCLSIFVIS